MVLWAKVFIVPWILPAVIVAAAAWVGWALAGSWLKRRGL